MKKAAGLNDQQIINQFPFEACLVMKHHLAETVQKVTLPLLFCKVNIGIHAGICLLLLNLVPFSTGSWISRVVAAHL